MITGRATGSVWRFGSVEFDEAKGVLQVGGRAVELDRNGRAIFAALLHRAGQDVSKEQLLQAGWPDRIVHENSLAKAIGRLRDALGEDGKLLETVYGHGYRLSVAFETEQEVGEDASANPQAAPAAETNADALPDAGKPRSRGKLPRFAAAFAAIVVIGSVAAYGINRANEDPPLRIGEPPDTVGRVLWVDDHPENNLKERRYLESQKFAVYTADSSKDAIALLDMYKYDAIISDMGRNDEPLAGIKLVRRLRARGNTTPYYIYTILPSKAQRRVVTEAGAQGVAVTPEELYRSVLKQPARSAEGSQADENRPKG